METYDVLIVEDETNIAEFHSYYLQQTQRFRPIGIAKSVAEAKKMIQLLKPKLVLLDNYLPDGKGIDLLKEITASKSSPDVIFITAANDMETVREGVRCGVFDYLLKPISYDRLADSLERYLKYTSSLNSNDSINQRHVDELFNFQSKTAHLQQLPKGIDELTLDKVTEAFDENEELYTADTLGKEVGISKTTARRYLEFLTAKGFVHAVIQHGRVGRPERVYKKR
ncbi:response regulator [Vibrio parahaemolyticus]|uniref:response regulator n=1 Tax=Vibrio natriegens TaxID=691 RepID=UPI001593E32F|nr:response regulator [Vibrio natriegens]NVC95288.1 response regulator [Vibrio natriegens]WMN89236.1 response regulator [Vibrio parahaemolyticus]